VRVIWTARLVLAMAVVMVISSAAFADYQSTGPRAGVAAETRRTQPSPPSLPHVPPPTSPPPRVPAGTIRAHLVLSGAIARDLTGPAALGSTFGGSCASRARGFFTISFTHDEQIDYRDDHVYLYVLLPDGAHGPGTYDLKDSRLMIGAQYAREGVSNQSWAIWAGSTRAVLVVRPDASGTFTASMLEPLLPQKIGNPLILDLNVALSFTCS
jgi:hypothetical protein